MNAKVLMLPFGVEVIGNVLEEDDQKLVMEHVLALNFEPTQGADGKTAMSFGFVPFSPLTEKKKEFRKNSVVLITEPRQGLRNAYQQATGSVLTPPSASPNPEILLG